MTLNELQERTWQHFLRATGEAMRYHILGVNLEGRWTAGGSNLSDVLSKDMIPDRKYPSSHENSAIGCVF